MSAFINWWNHFPEHISPVALRIGLVQVHYYGLMYLLAFLTVYLLVLYRLKNEDTRFKKESIGNYFLWVIASLLIGGRIG